MLAFIGIGGMIGAGLRIYFEARRLHRPVTYGDRIVWYVMVALGAIVLLSWLMSNNILAFCAGIVYLAIGSYWVRQNT
jgi:phosphate/sulfate permease